MRLGCARTVARVHDIEGPVSRHGLQCRDTVCRQAGGLVLRHSSLSRWGSSGPVSRQGLMSQHSLAREGRASVAIEKFWS